jgi:myosin heavy subunit
MLYKELLENIKLYSGKYKKDLLTAASTPLRQAVNLNPNHLGVNQLLADVLLAQGQAGEAREILEKLYQSQPAAARSRLIKALLALANACDDETEQLKLYKQVFELDAEQLEAKSAWQKIWQQRGDEAYKAGQLETALTNYRTAKLENKVAKLEEEIRNREIDTQLKTINHKAQANCYKEALQQVQQLADEYPSARDWDQIKQEILDYEIDTRLKVINDAKQANRYEEALEQLRQLAKEFPDKRDWAEDLEQLHPNAQLVDSQQSLELKKDDKEMGASALANSQKTNQFLHLSVKGTDVINVIKTMHQYANELNESRRQVQALTQLLEEEKNARVNSEKTLTESRQLLDKEKNALANSEKILTESRQLLDKEKNALANSEKILTESRKNVQELAGTIENKTNALAATKKELREYRQKGEELKQHITQEKNALINAEKLAKDKDEIANQYKQKIAQLKTELTLKEQTLSQVENKFKKTVDKDLTGINEKNVQKQVEAILAQQDKKKQVNFFPIIGTFILTLILILLGVLSWQFSLNNNKRYQVPVQEIIVRHEPVKIRSEPVKQSVPVIEKKLMSPVFPEQNLKTSQNLCVHFKKRSWLRVTDKSGEKILYEGIGNKGEILPLKGNPPFYMKVGNIGGVYVEYDCDVNQITVYPKQDGNKNLFIVGDDEW